MGLFTYEFECLLRILCLYFKILKKVKVFVKNPMLTIHNDKKKSKYDHVVRLQMTQLSTGQTFYRSANNLQQLTYPLQYIVIVDNGLKCLTDILFYSMHQCPMLRQGIECSCYKSLLVVFHFIQS